jgi:O-antigen/teichoic acid export membrane protein
MFRDIVKGVAKNTSIMLFQQLITWGSTFALMLFLPRYLGPVEYGWLFLAGSISDIFRIFVIYGGNYWIAKNVSRSHEGTSQILVDAVAFRFAFAVISVIAMVIFSYGLNYTGTVRILLLIFGTGLLWQGGITALYASYQGHELMQYTSAAAVVERVLVSFVSIGALLLGAHVIVVAVIITFGNLMNFLVLARFVRKVAASFPKINWAGVMRQIREGVAYFLFSIFSAIYYRIDSVMLSKMTPDEVVGWYGAAFRFLDSLAFLPYIVTVALYPVLSRLWRDAEQTHRRTTQKSIELMIIAGMPMGIGVVFFADKIVHLFYGLSSYEPSVIVLQVLSTGLLFLYVDMVLGTTMMASDRQKQFSLISLAVIPVKVLLNYFMIPYFQAQAGNGGIGAAVATVLTELCVMSALLKLMPEQTLKGFRISVVSKTVLASALMGGFLWSLKVIGVSWVVQVLAAPVVYVLSQLLLKTLEPAEASFLREYVGLGFKAIGQVTGMRKSNVREERT